MRNRKSITIHDVAAAAGVSISTVSRVLNDKEDVSAETYARVQQVIAELGYASSLAERNIGFGSLSVPIFNYNGTLLGCISIVIPEIRHQDDDHYQFCLYNLLRITKELY